MVDPDDLTTPVDKKKLVYKKPKPGRKKQPLRVWTEEEAQDLTTMLITMPAELKRAFKIKCYENKKDMCDVIRILMRGYLLR